MGVPKFALRYNKKLSFLEKIVSEYEKFLCNEIIVVVNNRNRKELEKIKHRISAKVKFVINNYPERERFYSIKIGLENSSLRYPTFIHNVDNPFVSQKVLCSLSEQSNYEDYVVPIFRKKGGHPILLSQKIIKFITEKSNYNENFRDFLSNFEKIKTYVNDDTILININTKKKYENLLQL